MDWTQPIDAYCERLGDGFWAEPLNALSNLAFLLAAAIGLALWRRTGRSDRPLFLLSCLVAVIGVGSFLFHTFANRWSSLADVLPIALFIYAYFFLALLRLVGLGRWVAGLGTAGFLVASILSEPFLAGLVGSSAGYVPALLAMLGIGSYLVATGHGAGPLVLAAGMVFTVSLGMRMADAPLCAAWPTGTHVFWHILNAATLKLLLAATTRTRGGQPATAASNG
ncbi:ceramidase domain-containing protein [Aurantimonas sp. A2-1-M11]|uniref:ceramidase domain-containing protein n=1 Tax=Aurantimonas sp. A2-1-M11 TaxID=3113712 RepID=UPI002F9492CB